MHTLRVHDVLKDKVLVSRESARLLEVPLEGMIATEGTTVDSRVTVDFEGVEGIAPSFLDELLTIFESLVGGEQCLVIANAPTRLSLKFEAVARGHEMSVRALPDGSWLVSGRRDPGP